MSTVRVGSSGRVTLPATLPQKAGLKAGDVLEAKTERGKITLTSKSLIDRRIAKSLADYEAGRSYGPFETADELISSLQRNMKKRPSKKRRNK